MIRVLFFASLRERLGCSDTQLPWSAQLASVAGLRRSLVERGGETWREALEADNVIKAVNQVVVDDEAPVADGDEVAFFPPVTGG